MSSALLTKHQQFPMTQRLMRDDGNGGVGDGPMFVDEEKKKKITLWLLVQARRKQLGEQEQAHVVVSSHGPRSPRSRNEARALGSCR